MNPADASRPPRRRPGWAALVGGLAGMGLTAGWPLAAIHLGLGSTSMMPTLTVLCGVVAFTGLAPLLTGIERPFLQFNTYGGWRKACVVGLGVLGFGAGLAVTFYVDHQVRRSGYSIVRIDGDQRRVEGPETSDEAAVPPSHPATSAVAGALQRELDALVADGGAKVTPAP